MKSLYTRLVSTVFFPLHEKLKKHSTVAIRESLEKSQWQDRETILAQQATRLGIFVEKIYQSVPYYRNCLDKLGLKPNEFQSISDLEKLPFLSKALISENFEQLKSAEAGALKRFNTGGSSGEPLIFLLGNERVSHDVAEKWRATRWWDVDIGDREIVAWGSPIELGSQDRLKLFRDKIFRSELIPAFHMSEDNLLTFIDKIKCYKPKMLFGYPSVFDLIAKTAVKHNITLSDVGIKVAFVTSERLYPYQRDNIQKVFGCPVANGYGGRDAGFIAHECPKGGMHISAEDIVVEVIDSQGNVLPNGETGEIVVTHMGTSEFPFVRYRTGDVGTLSDRVCHCGRGLPLLENIEGRTTDFVVAFDGTIMHGLALIYILRDLEEVGEFKIIQENLTHTRIELVPRADYSEELAKQIKQGFKARLGQEVEITIKVVNRVDAEKSGKFRYVISKVHVA